MWGKGKSVPLEAWSGPEGSRKLKFSDFVTTFQDGGKPYAPAAFTYLLTYSLHGAESFLRS